MRTNLQNQDIALGEMQPATLQFLSEWRQIQQGNIVPGVKLIIEYDPERLPHCRLTWRGAQVWDIEAFIKFHPGGEFYTGSLLEKIRQPPGHGMVVALQPKGYEVVVPMGATQVELWFRNSYQVSSRCEAWDSRFGQNYWFNVTPG
jgi:hypothetical protein